MKTLIKLLLLTVFLLTALTFTLNGCGDDDDDDDDGGGVGTLEFYTNGEEFIQNGFVGKTGWAISFDHFYVNYNAPTAFQVPEDQIEIESKLTTPQSCLPAHAGHPHTDIPDGAAHVALLNEYWIDLKTAGPDGTNRVLLDAIENAPIGNYNFINFAVSQGSESAYAGYSIVMIGAATKDSDTITFTIKLNEEMAFSDCQQTVDDENAGVVSKGGVGSVEITFHSDHLFGDYEALGETDSVNDVALGFQPFADIAVDGALDIDQAEMKSLLSDADYDTFMEALFTTGHSGEGHCHYDEFEELE